jgi:glutathione S-transferase
MLELYQAEWCPSSRRVRHKLTELGLDFLARQVPADSDARLRLLLKTGTDSIPVLVDGSRTIKGADSILAYLGEHYETPGGAAAHRAKAVVFAYEGERR